LNENTGCLAQRHGRERKSAAENVFMNRSTSPPDGDDGRHDRGRFGTPASDAAEGQYKIFNKQSRLGRVNFFTDLQGAKNSVLYARVALSGSRLMDIERRKAFRMTAG